MAKRKIAIVVLGAGMGTRMKSSRPKVLHHLAGRPMLSHVLAAAEQLDPEKICVVVGPGMEAVAEAAAPHDVIEQTERLGTGHAVGTSRAAFNSWLEAGETFDLLVVYGDTPLLRGETLQRMLERRAEADQPAMVGMAFRPEDPARYGRFILDPDGRVERIVEFADADEAVLSVDLCNAGMVMADGARLFDWIARLSNDNAQGEYYLTDIYGLARQDGELAVVIEAPEEEVRGADDRRGLASAEKVIQRRLRESAMAAGVTMIDPDTVWLSWDTVLANDVVIQPNVFFGPGVVVEEGAEIRAFFHLEGARVGPATQVGPFARLRPGAVLDRGARIGNFVEVKNAHLKAGAKANHLTYLGDSTVGEKANVGAGTITCNYDGFAKHRTEIGSGAFIGSNSALVAPVKVGAGAIIGAGSTITEDVDKDALGIARGRQTTIRDGGRNFRATRSAAKSKGE